MGDKSKGFSFLPLGDATICWKVEGQAEAVVETTGSGSLLGEARKLMW